MNDKILEMFFDLDRWKYAIDKGMVKEISKTELYKLTQPEVRIRMCEAIRDGRYQIAPPHTAQIPKDNGEFRTVYVNEPIDRVFLSIANDLLFGLMPDMRHKNCQSYIKGVGCGKIVKGISQLIADTNGAEIGWKADLSKYFDSVPIEYVDKAFDDVEAEHGHSAVIDVLRKYYHSDYYFDKHELKSAYQSLKQGCSVASWLADVILYHIDDKLSSLNGYYIRYCDDMLFIGPDYQKAMDILTEELSKMQMKLNPKKVEYLSSERWFKFLGYSIRGSRISLSANRLKTFQREVEARTIRKKDTTLKKALNAIHRYMYKGDGEFSWATQILPVCNVEKDLNELNKFVMDCLRAVSTGKKKVGGLGFSASGEHCVLRGVGRNVSANRLKIPRLDGYYTIACMRQAMRCGEVYKTIIASL